MSSGLRAAPRRIPRRTARLSPEELGRVRDWVEREIEFVDQPLFHEGDAEQRLSELRPASLDAPSVAEKGEPGIAFVAGLVQANLLTPAEEVYLFTWMNFLKFRAEQTRQRLSLNSPDLSIIERVEADLAEAVSVRNRIVSSNLRLVVSLAKKLSTSMDQMAELIGEATIPLIRSVELFNVGLGNRFSTYATWAARNHMLRCQKRRQLGHERTVDLDQNWLERVADQRGNPEEDARSSRMRSEAVGQLLDSLTERERFVIKARFGLDGQPRGQSLQDIACHVGLSKERVRQIVIHAIEKLQGVVSVGSDVAT